MTILSTGLETDNYGSPGWNHIYNRNMDLLNYELLKLRALTDVDMDSIVDGSPFIWNSVTSKWEALRNG